jgi:hypothetical protein
MVELLVDKGADIHALTTGNYFVKCGFTPEEAVWSAANGYAEPQRNLVDLAVLALHCGEASGEMVAIKTYLEEKGVFKTNWAVQGGKRRSRRSKKTRSRSKKNRRSTRRH